MKEFVVLRKTGKFYSAYEEDAYVMHAIMGYKISNGRVGFPCEVLGKVLGELESSKVNYKVIEKDKEVSKKKFAKNNYIMFYSRGKKSSKEELEQKELIEKIRNLSKEEMDQVIHYIKEFV